MQARRTGLTRTFTNTLDEFLLPIIVKVILTAEEDNTTLRDYSKKIISFYREEIGGDNKVLILPVIARSLMSSSEFGARSHSLRLTLVNSLPITG